MCYFFQMANMQHFNNPLIKIYVSYVSDHMKYMMNVKNLVEEIWRKICELFQVTNIMNIISDTNTEGWLLGHKTSAILLVRPDNRTIIKLTSKGKHTCIPLIQVYY